MCYFIARNEKIGRSKERFDNNNNPEKQKDKHEKDNLSLTGHHRDQLRPIY